MTPQQEDKLDKIHELLAGTLETPGLVHKMRTMEKHVNELNDYKEKDEKFKAKVAGGMAVGTPIFVIAWHWVQKHILGW